MPGQVGGGFLEPGDTIESERAATTMEALGTIAEELSDDVSATLEQARLLLAAIEMAFLPPNISPRIGVQRGVLTVHPDPQATYAPAELERS